MGLQENLTLSNSVTMIGQGLKGRGSIPDTDCIVLFTQTALRPSPSAHSCRLGTKACVSSWTEGSSICFPSLSDASYVRGRGTQGTEKATSAARTVEANPRHNTMSSKTAVIMMTKRSLYVSADFTSASRPTAYFSVSYPMRTMGHSRGSRPEC
jgi:hypothetical protein